MSFNSQIATIVNFHSEKKSLFSEESYKKFREKHCRSDFKKNAAAFAQLGYMNIPSIENAEAVSDNYKTMAFKNRIWEKIARPIEMKSVLISPIPKYS